MGCPTAPHSLTDAACVLKLDLKHLHGGGHDDLASTSPAACQHLPVQSQLLPAAEQMGATVKSRSPSAQSCPLRPPGAVEADAALWAQYPQPDTPL